MHSGWLFAVPLAVVAGFGVAGSIERHAEAFLAPPAAVEPERVDRPAHLVLAAETTLEAPFSLHYAPTENLERVDVRLIDDAVHAIDMAAYVLTDYPVIEALTHAAERGVVIRILLDREQYGRQADRGFSAPFQALRAAPSVRIRVKTSNVLMHLKAYQIDGRVLRTGSANLSASGLKQQDNDLLVLESPAAAARFIADFEPAFASGAED